MRTKSGHPVCRWGLPQWKPITLAAVLSLLAIISTALAGGHNANPGVIPPQAHPYGQSYGEWGADWWKWALSTPEANNPVLDLTGVDASVNQSGPVFFLAGTFGAEPVVRNVTVESGEALFIPILNWNQTYLEDVPGVPRDQAEAAMRATLNAFFDGVDPTDLHCEVDGVALGNLSAYRAQSPVYSMYFAPDSISVTLWGYAAGEHDLNVSDGYWVMLAPLFVGNHTIRVRYASYLDVTYHLTVQGGANVSGRLTADWWQWVLGIPADINPLLDQTGANAAIGQSGPVWFPAGTTGGTAERTITVLAGKSLFFPLANNVWISTPGDPPWRRPYTDPTTGEAYRSFEEYVRTVLLKPTTDAATVSCEVDGQPVVGMRCQSPTFQVKLPDNNLFGVDRGVYGPSADDGIYVLLPPLPPGNHTIHFTAAQPDGSWALDVTDHLTVKAAKK